jgi:Txe/YoeB family toxin of Txe-Axe toxin-antitoxin module
MTYFEVEIDNKFNELINKMKRNDFNLNDLIQLKTFIRQTYSRENNIEDTNIKKSFRKINYKY